LWERETKTVEETAWRNNEVRTPSEGFWKGPGARKGAKIHQEKKRRKKNSRSNSRGKNLYF